MANRKSVAHVYGIMEELQQLRDKVSTLSEKNRQLAKALNTTKQELVKARTAQNSVFSDKVVAWMEARHKATEVRDQAVQCNFLEHRMDAQHERLFSQESSPSEPESLYSPRRSDRNGGDISIELMATISEHKSSRPGFPGACIAAQIHQPPCLHSSDCLATLKHEDAQTDVKRRLRQRDANMSYVEPKLNTKLRRGDYYGLGQRARLQSKKHQAPKRRIISDTRTVTSAFVPSLFGQQCSPFRRRTMRHAQRISYAEPKLNTKLRKGDKFTFTT